MSEDLIKMVDELSGNPKFSGDIYERTTVVYTLGKSLTNEYADLCLSNKFFAYMLTQSFDFENEEDYDNFIRKIFLDAGKEIGKYTDVGWNIRDYHTHDAVFNISVLTALDKNGDGSWFSEFFDIMNKSVEGLNETKNYAEAKSIDVDALFGEKEELT